MRGGSTRFYHPDIIGTTRTTSNASAAVSSTLETDAFGNTWTPGTSGVQSPFGYAGQHGYQTDSDSGLMRVGYRYYDALSGRFISRDPIRAGGNWYTYCDNDPVNTVDPTGLYPPSERDLRFGDDPIRPRPQRPRYTDPDDQFWGDTPKPVRGFFVGTFVILAVPITAPELAATAWGSALIGGTGGALGAAAAGGDSASIKWAFIQGAIGGAFAGTGAAHWWSGLPKD